MCIEDSVSVPYMTSIFIGDLLGAEGGRVREGPGVVIVSCLLHTVNIYLEINKYLDIDYIFKYNQQINSASARNRREIFVVFNSTDN